MKRVLITQNSAAQGGVEQYTLDIVEGLKDKFELYVMCGDGELVDKYRQAGAKIVIDTPKIECDFLYSFRVAKFCREKEIDVIHANQLKAGSLSIFGAFLAGVSKRIYHVHTPVTTWKLSQGKKLLVFWVNWLVNWFVGNVLATDVLALTQATKKIRVEQEKINPQKITAIPDGVRINDFIFSGEQKLQLRGELRRKLGVDESTVVVGTLSRLTEEKGLEYFVEAVEQLNRGWHSVIAGKGDLRESLEKKVQELGLSDRLTFLGFVEDRAKYYAALDIFVFPSVAEGFGISLIEALASGVACVASDLPVLQEVGGEGVAFFKAEDSSDLSQVLEKMVFNPQVRVNLASRARPQAQKFSLSKFWEAYIKLYS